MRNFRVTPIAAAVALLCSRGYAQTTVAGSTPGGFRVLENGAPEYSMAIRVPPGVAGMEPKLGIVVRSGGAGGILGLGGALQGLAVIQRCSKTIVQDGFVSGVNYDGNDRFCIDGGRLVAVSGAYGADGTEYRTERESFTKIVSYGVAGNGPAWFKAWTKSGQILEFGNTADSRIEAQGKSTPGAWALSKASDTKGNYFSTSYTEDNANGDYQISRIDYTGNASAGLTTSRSVRFTYEARTDTPATYIGGSVVKTMQRLTNVKTYVGEGVVTDYRMTYEYAPSSGPSRLTSIKECTGDGLQCFAPANFTWQNATAGSFTTSTWSNASVGCASADLNGDYLGDLVCVVTGGAIQVRYSTGTGFSAPVTVDSLCTDEYGKPLAGISLGDFDGDGRADIATTCSAGAPAVWLSKPSGFIKSSWSGVPTVGLGSCRSADVNGDGLADLICTATGGGLTVSYSTGASFSAPVTVDTVCTTNEYGAPVAISVGDFDGDGRADIATSCSAGAPAVWLSKPSGFAKSAWSGAAGGCSTGDVNGDDLADLVCTASGGLINVSYSTGVGFSAPATIALTCTDEYGNAMYPLAVGDFDGNDRRDILAAASGSCAATTTLTSAGVPDQLSSIATSAGTTIGITYKPLTDATVYTGDSDASWPVRDVKPQRPMYPVSSVASSNGIGGNRVTNYFYRGAKVHMTGGGFLGFRQVEETDTGTGITSVSAFRQTYPYRGFPTQVLRKQSSGTVISQQDNSWTDTTLTPASGSGGNYHKSELTQWVTRSYELNGTLVTTVTSTSGYDGYGNVTSVVVGTGDGYSKTTTNTYANDTVNWFLGRLTRSTVQSTTP